MAVAGELSPPGKPSLNPLKCSGTSLPIPVLLMAKLTAVCILLSQEWRGFSDAFLPFIAAFSHFGPSPLFRWSLKAIFLVASAALLFNRYVRVACLAIGTVFLVAVLSSRIYFQNNLLFVGCLFFLAGLSEPGEAPWLLRCQVILVYFSAGLNKLLDAGWRSGAFFSTWGAHFVKEKFYFQVESWLPGGTLAGIFSWLTIASELGLSALLLNRRSRVTAIWLGIFFHTGLLFLTGRTFGLFYYAILASYLAFIEWPRGPVTVLYDGDCGFCASIHRFFEAIALEPFAEWIPFQSAKELYGIRKEANQRIHAVVDGRVYVGFAAIKVLILYNPVVYFVFAAILAIPEPASFPYRRWVAVSLWIALALFFNRFGERANERRPPLELLMADGTGKTRN